MLQEKMQQIIDKNAFAKMMGIEILEIREGYARGRLVMNELHTNIYGGMHGGCMYAFADTIAGIASISYGNYVSTIDGKMNYLLPVKDTEYVICEAKVLRQGGKIGIYNVTLTGDRKQVFATADFTYYRMDKRLE